MALSHGILGFLTYGEMSGYDLSKAFGSSLRFFWHVQNSHIYLELGKLEKKGYVTCEVVPQTEKPNKKLYTITEAGKNEFLRWLSEENKDFSREIKSAFLMKVFFSGNTSPAQSIAMLEKFIRDCRGYEGDMETIPDSIRLYGQFAQPYHTLYWEMTADFGRAYMDMCIAWAERCIRRLEELA